MGFVGGLSLNVEILCIDICQAGFYSIPTGQGKLEKVREFVLSGKDQGKILFF